MKIHTHIVIDLHSGEVLEDNYFDYDGPIASCDPITAGIGVGGALLGGVISGDASRSAANKQADASKFATDTQWRMFDTINGQNQPFRDASYGALDKLQNFTKLNADDPNSFMHKFGAEDLNSNLAPNWQFAMDQGQGAARNAMNASGGMMSGNTLKGLQDYTIGKSGDLYQQAFQNFTGNQTNIFNRLATIAGIGQTANQTTANAGMNAAGNIGNSIQNMGAAQAAGQVGQANAISGALNNAGSWYGASRFLNGNNSPGSGAQQWWNSGTQDFANG